MATTPFTLDLVHKMLVEILAGGTGADVSLVDPTSTATASSLFTGTSAQLRICLVELRENQKLRQKTGDDPPRFGYYRLDCHYLLFARAGNNMSLAHLLYTATLALNDAIPLVPTRTLRPTGALWAFWPEEHRDHEFPLRVNPAEGFARAPELWTALNTGDRFVAPVYFIVTVPVHAPQYEEAPRVTTVRAQVGSTGNLGRLVRIGGHVYRSQDRPLAAATVILADEQTGQTLATTVTDASGAYLLGLPADRQCRLFAVWPGLGITPVLTVAVDDSTSLEPYDLTFN